MLWAQFRQAGTLGGTPVCEPVRATCEPLGGVGGGGYGILWLPVTLSQTALGKSLFWFAAQLAEGRVVALFSLLAAWPSRWFSGAVMYTLPYCPAKATVFIHAHGLKLL